MCFLCGVFRLFIYHCGGHVSSSIIHHSNIAIRLLSNQHNRIFQLLSHTSLPSSICYQGCLLCTIILGSEMLLQTKLTFLKPSSSLAIFLEKVDDKSTGMVLACHLNEVAIRDLYLRFTFSRLYWYLKVLLLTISRPS